MPFLIPIAVGIAGAVGAVAGVVGGVVGGIAGAIGGIASGIAGALGGVVGGLGATGGIGKLLLQGALTVGLSLLSHHSNINSGAQIQFKADKTAGVPYLMGRTGTGGNIVFQDTSSGDKNKYLHSFVVFSHGPVDSFESFTANQTAVSFTSSAATTAPWSGKMWLRTQIGAQPETVMTAPAGTGSIPEWTSSHLLSGLAAARWIAQSDATAYPTGLPQPLWVWKGVKVYDPRLDSTYPGGSGAQRAATPSTWAWSENPWLHALTFCIGQTANGVRVIGLGADITTQIDTAAFVTAANVADANGWKIGGVVTSTDSKWDVLKTICQAGGGQPVRQGSTISCIVSTPLVSVATLTGAELVGDAQITGSQPRRARINSITPTYRSEAHNWEMVAADPVTISGYVSADGQLRSRAVTYTLVQQVNQAAQLAYYDIVNGREFGPVVLPLKARWNGLKPGDCITLNESELGMSSQTLLILTRQRDPATGMPTITCISETNAKHAAALALSGTAPPTPSLNAINPTPDVPATASWAAAGTTVTNSGVSIPAVVLTGAVEQAGVTSAHVYYRAHGATEWTSYGLYGGTVTRVENTSVASGGVYDVGVAYVGRGGEGPILTLNNSGSGYTAGTFVGSGVTDNKTPTAVNWTFPGASGGNPTTDTSVSQTFASINIPITLTLNTSGVSGSGLLEYSKNGGTWTTFTSGSTVSVSITDALAFRATNSTASSTYSGTLTIVNTTDSSTTLDTAAWSAVVGGTDVTPDAVSWADTVDESNLGDAFSPNQTFHGINAAITLTITYTGVATMRYSKNGAAYTGVSSGGTISISNGDVLAWEARKFAPPGTYTGVVTVTNTTDGGAVLDTFNYFLQPA